jgi:hypothetical protein
MLFLFDHDFLASYPALRAAHVHFRENADVAHYYGTLGDKPLLAQTSTIDENDENDEHDEL